MLTSMVTRTRIYPPNSRWQTSYVSHTQRPTIPNLPPPSFRWDSPGEVLTCYTTQHLSPFDTGSRASKWKYTYCTIHLACQLSWEGQIWKSRNGCNSTPYVHYICHVRFLCHVLWLHCIFSMFPCTGIPYSAFSHTLHPKVCEIYICTCVWTYDPQIQLFHDQHCQNVEIMQVSEHQLPVARFSFLTAVLSAAM